MKIASFCGVAAISLLTLSSPSFALNPQPEPPGVNHDSNVSIQHSSPTLTTPASNCAVGDAAGSMTARNNSATATPAPGSNLMASDAGTGGNTSAGMDHNNAGGGAIGTGLSAGSMGATHGGTPADVSYNINKCTGSTAAGSHH